MKFLGPPSSGSTAGTTFSHNRAGQYTRNRRTPVVGTRTPRQAVIKANMTSASQAWQVLTVSQQNAWASYATGHPIVDALGQSIKLTGHQYFIKCAAALLNVSAPLPTDPPVSGTVAPESVIEFQVDESGTFLVNRNPGSATDYVAVAVSKSTSLGVNFQKTFHQIGAFAASREWLSLGPEALAWMGTFTVGTKAWLRLTPVNQYGLTGTPLISQTRIVAAPVIATPVMTSPLAGSITATWGGAPTTANIVKFMNPTGTGPWTSVTGYSSETSPWTNGGNPTGQFATVMLQDPSTGLYGPLAAPILIT